MTELFLSYADLASAIKAATGWGTSGEDYASFRLIGNGIVVTLAERVGLEKGAEPAEPQKVVEESPKVAPTPEQSPSVDDEACRKIQQALRPHMTRVPGLRTIRAYDEDQRARALRWARARANGKDVARPGFIQEPMERRPRSPAAETKPEPEKPKPEPSTSNGVSEALTGSVDEFYGAGEGG